MTDDPDKASRSAREDIARHAATSQPSQLRELMAYVVREKKWFLAPIILLIFLVGLFVLLTGTAVAPFIYTLF